MRVGKKVKVVEAKRTRSCVVRIEKVNSPPLKTTRSSITNTPTGSNAPKVRGIIQEEKKFRGPIKKRPISQTSSISPTQQQTPKVKDREKPKEVVIKKATPIMEVSTPTIAAGRSRRAIKPNPKYASEDMVTPKMIKHVGTPSTNKKSSERKRLISTSSDDFFNKESSDEVDFDEYDDTDDKVYKNNEKESDSDFTDEEQRQTKKRVIRQQKPEVAGTSQQHLRGQIHTPSTSVTSKLTTPSTTKSTVSLQQLRKTLVNNQANSRIITGSPAVKKRKIDVINEQIEVARKRFLMSSGMSKSSLEKSKSIVRQPQSSQSTPTTTPRNLSNQTLNGSKIVHVDSADSSPSLSEKRKQMPDKVVSKTNIKPTQVRTSTTTPEPGKTTTTKLQTFSKLRNTSPKAVVKHPQQSEKKIITSPKLIADDLETMPTFTIVNINDIINKKGDVLISKSGTKNAAKPLKPQSEENSNVASNTAGRRKATHTTILSEKEDPDRTKSALPRTPHPAKKPAQTILNHTLLNKTSPNQRSTVLSGKVNTSPINKPAPRILNSMVAKKTQPVKPMIANPDDSADESFPLSLDDDEEPEEVDEDDMGIGEDAKYSAEPKTASKPFSTTTKKTPPATKENSLAATNRLPPKVGQRKISPEKVVISRQGDKIIKKITCFETWFVINAPVEKPVKLERNQLEIALIELANVAQEIKLPSECWSPKVSLYETPIGTVDKTKLPIFTGDLKEHNIAESDRSKYQPSCVMFRRKATSDRLKSRLPYDRAVIFKNKTFFTNIDGKNIKLIGAPTSINSQNEVEILLHIVDTLTLQSALVEPASTAQ